MFRSRNLLNNPTQNPVLPDIGFDLLPYSSICENSLLPTYLLLFLMCTRLNKDFIILISTQQRIHISSKFFFPVVTFCRMILFDDQGVIVFCRFAIVDGIVMSLRATTVAVTSVLTPISISPLLLLLFSFSFSFSFRSLSLNNKRLQLKDQLKMNCHF
jgi:hypothetical protein